MWWLTIILTNTSQAGTPRLRQLPTYNQFASHSYLLHAFPQPNLDGTSMGALSASPRPPEQPISTLGTPHREVLACAVANILSSSAAKQTYGQIVDGLPLADVAWDRYAGCLCLHHPLLNEHKKLCSGVAEETEGLLSSFDLGSLLMPSEVREHSRYSITSPLMVSFLGPERLPVGISGDAEFFNTPDRAGC
jgi:hypothetical protein